MGSRARGEIRDGLSTALLLLPWPTLLPCPACLIPSACVPGVCVLVLCALCVVGLRLLSLFRFVLFPRRTCFPVRPQPSLPILALAASLFHFLYSWVFLSPGRDYPVGSPSALLGGAGGDFF